MVSKVWGKKSYFLWGDNWKWRGLTKMKSMYTRRENIQRIASDSYL